MVHVVFEWSGVSLTETGGQVYSSSIFMPLLVALVVVAEARHVEGDHADRALVSLLPIRRSLPCLRARAGPAGGGSTSSGSCAGPGPN